MFLSKVVNLMIEYLIFWQMVLQSPIGGSVYFEERPVHCFGGNTGQQKIPPSTSILRTSHYHGTEL